MLSRERISMLEKLAKWKKAEPPLYYTDDYYTDGSVPVFVCLRKHSKASMTKDGLVPAQDNKDIQIPTRYMDVFRGYVEGSSFVAIDNWIEDKNIFSHLKEGRKIIINGREYALRIDDKDISQRGHFLFAPNSDRSRTNIAIELKEGVNLLSGIAAYLTAYVNYFEEPKLLAPKPRDIIDYCLTMFGQLDDIAAIKRSIKGINYSDSMLSDLKNLLLPSSQKDDSEY